VLPENVTASLKEVQRRSFLSPLFLAQALASQDIAGIDIALVSNRMQQVFDEPVRNPARAVLLGPVRVIPLELPGITCRSIDVDLESEDSAGCAARIVAEVNSSRENNSVAFRHGERFVETVEPIDLTSAPEHNRLEIGGVYLITGGLGGIGLVVAERLAREFKARLVLVSRSPVPPEALWKASLNDGALSDAEQLRIQKLIDIRSIAGGYWFFRAMLQILSRCGKWLRRPRSIMEEWTVSFMPQAFSMMAL